MATATDLQQLSTLNSARSVLSTTTRMLRDAGHTGDADRIIRLATASTVTPVVVFVGESGRGKSSIVNLLAPDLRSSESGEAGHAMYRIICPLKEGNNGITTWVYPDGSRSTAAPTTEHAIGVEVETTNGLLGDVILLDAPSSGGLAGPQSLLNLKILEAASVAVFVTDAGSLLSSAELAYLEQCSAQVESLGLVVTRTDLYPRSWQDVVKGNAALLKAQIPRLANSFVIGLSSTTAMEADSIPDPSIRDNLMNASGLPQLTRALKSELARAGSAPTANGLRLAHTTLDAHRRALLTQRMIADDPAQARAGMIAERHRLAELKDQQQRWTLDLDRDLGELRAGVLRKTGLKLDRWTAEWKTRIQSTKALRDEKTAGQVTNDIFAELLALRAEFIKECEEQLTHLTQGVFRDIPLPAVLDEILKAAEPPAEAPQLGSDRRAAGFDPSMIMSVVMGSGMGSTAFSIVGGLTGGSSIAFMAVGAGGWFAINRYFRQNALEKTRLLGEIPRLAQAERLVIADYLDARLRRLKPEIVVAYRAQLQESLAGLQELIRESQAQEKLSSQASLQRIQALERDVSIINKKLAEIDASLTKLRLL